MSQWIMTSKGWLEGVSCPAFRQLAGIRLVQMLRTLQKSQRVLPSPPCLSSQPIGVRRCTSRVSINGMGRPCALPRASMVNQGPLDAWWVLMVKRISRGSEDRLQAGSSHSGRLQNLPEGREWSDASDLAGSARAAVTTAPRARLDGCRDLVSRPR